jgi:hypothetical protein
MVSQPRRLGLVQNNALHWNVNLREESHFSSESFTSYIHTVISTCGLGMDTHPHGNARVRIHAIFLLNLSLSTCILSPFRVIPFIFSCPVAHYISSTLHLIRLQLTPVVNTASLSTRETTFKVLCRKKDRQVYTVCVWMCSIHPAGNVTQPMHVTINRFPVASKFTWNWRNCRHMVPQRHCSIEKFSDHRQERCVLSVQVSQCNVTISDFLCDS